MSVRGEEFENALAELAKPSHSIGAVIKTGHFLVAGNTPMVGTPYLLPLSMDDQGRMWIERDGAMLCVFDTRAKER